MLGIVSEADDGDESIIPADAEELDTVTGPSGLRVDDEPLEQDRDPGEPDHPSEIQSSDSVDQLLSPRDALVAPDVTPQAMEPLDASDVPRGQQPAAPQGVPRYWSSSDSKAKADVNPMDVFLGRSGAPGSQPKMEPEHVMTAEAAQASVGTMLNIGGASGESLLRAKQPMPDPTPGDAGKIMEAFNRYGPKRTWSI